MASNDASAMLNTLFQLLGYFNTISYNASDIAAKFFRDLPENTAKKHLASIQNGKEYLSVFPSFAMGQEAREMLNEHGIESQILSINGEGYVFFDEKDRNKADQLINDYYARLHSGEQVTLDAIWHYGSGNVMKVVLPTDETDVLIEKCANMGIPHAVKVNELTGNATVYYARKDQDKVNYMRTSIAYDFGSEVKRNLYHNQRQWKGEYYGMLKSFMMDRADEEGNRLPDDMVITNGRGYEIELGKNTITVRQSAKPVSIRRDDTKMLGLVAFSWDADDGVKEMLLSGKLVVGDYSDRHGRSLKVTDSGIEFRGYVENHTFSYGDDKNSTRYLAEMFHNDTENMAGVPVFVNKQTSEKLHGMPKAELNDTMVHILESSGKPKIYDLKLLADSPDFDGIVDVQFLQGDQETTATIEARDVARYFGCSFDSVTEVMRSIAQPYAPTEEKKAEAHKKRHPTKDEAAQIKDYLACHPSESLDYKEFERERRSEQIFFKGEQDIFNDPVYEELRFGSSFQDDVYRSDSFLGGDHGY